MTLNKWNSKLLAYLLGLIVASFSAVTLAELQPGATAPSFTAPAALAGQTFTFTLNDALKKGPVVVYFYPKAFTTGCTIEANLFAQAMDEFKQYNATVIGVSADDMDTLTKFSTGPCGGKFAVASDLDRKIIQAYDAALKIRPDMADRISYVVTPDHKILLTFSSMSPDQHVSQSLAAVRTWHTKTIEQKK